VLLNQYTKTNNSKQQTTRSPIYCFGDDLVEDDAAIGNLELAGQKFGVAHNRLGQYLLEIFRVHLSGHLNGLSDCQTTLKPIS